MRIIRAAWVEVADQELLEQLLARGDLGRVLEELRCAKCESRLEVLKSGRHLRCTRCMAARVELELP